MRAPPLNPEDAEAGHSKFEGPSPDAIMVTPGESKFGIKSFFKMLLTSTLFETRGIERVDPADRHRVSTGAYLQMFMLWFSANLTANNLALGLLGPSVYDLSYLDCALCATFGALLGSAGTGYAATFGPRSGNRTMIIARYSMGWWPSRICVLLNIVIMLGYGMIDSVVGGQLLSAVADNDMTVIVGVIITAVITWAVTVFGLPLFHIYERYAWAPQMAMMFILAGVAGPYFDTATPSVGDSVTINANRLTFFSLCLSGAVAWAPSGADYYVYYPESTPKYITFILTWLGEAIASIFVFLLGIGIATGVTNNSTWAAANDISSGALIVAAYGPLGRFGKFCGVIVALGVIANNVPGTYSSSLGFQCLGRWPAKIPRYVWNTFGAIVYTICAAVGRNHLYTIFQNFLALMGYWVTIWIAITVEEQLIFRRRIGYDWSKWNDKSYISNGFAALAAFLIGWAGSVIDMDQVYFIGPIAKLVGAYGADMGIYVGVGFAGITYPPLRWLELRYIGK